MTRQEFKESLVRLYPQVATAIDTVPLPRVAWDVAAYCFWKNVGESSDTLHLQQQLTNIEMTGCFNFEGEGG